MAILESEGSNHKYLGLVEFGINEMLTLNKIETSALVTIFVCEGFHPGVCVYV